MIRIKENVCAQKIELGYKWKKKKKKKKRAGDKMENNYQVSSKKDSLKHSL